VFSAFKFRDNPLPYIVFVFVISRIIYFGLGVRFDDTLLDYGWQYLDPPLLSKSVASLAQNLFYMYGQPPGFNLFLGIALLIFKGKSGLAFSIIYWVLGLIFSCSISRIMSRLGVDNRINFILYTIFIVSPACILIENCLFYAYPIATCLVVATLFLLKFFESGSFRDALIICVSLGAIASMWSLFHLSWLILVMLPIFGLLIYRRDVEKLKTLGLAYALPLFFIVAIYAKNAVLFGNFSPSGWLGMSVAKITYSKMPSEERIKLVKSGAISELSAITTWSSPKEYPARYFSFTKKGVPALDELRKTVGPPNFYNVNYHNLGYLEISKQYLKDALYVISNEPKYYIDGVKDAYSYWYLMPATSWAVFDYGYSQPSRTAIAPIVNFYNRIVLGCIVPQATEKASIPDKDQNIYFGPSYLLVVLVPFLTIYSFYLALRKYQANFLESAAFFLFIGLNLLFVTVFCNLIETGENQRYRFSIDALYLILLGCLGTEWLNKAVVIFKRISTKNS
jgi:hypothetical protein